MKHQCAVLFFLFAISLLSVFSAGPALAGNEPFEVSTSGVGSSDVQLFVPTVSVDTGQYSEELSVDLDKRTRSQRCSEDCRSKQGADLTRAGVCSGGVGVAFDAMFSITPATRGL